ncbi:MAG: cytochrome c biogenesis protein CcdA [Anaerolineales bacterium]|nr:cytochrome c biogenesis protein CcdA [Anaerolineales bacterium]MBP6208506.1 cytochrome c biogenesis protein CcdA [Anaerolineales bacterium]MBP8165290.1 cytochrome c biogenesis protein CcdA [Anaerolineales bacterium]
MEISQISVGLALLAGLASFLSPCVFSLVPAYVGYLGGLATGSAGAITSGSNRSGRWVTFSHGLAFVLGFSVVFVLLGVAASFAGGLLYDLREWLAKIGGIVVIIFGLHMIGVFHIPFLAYDTRVQQAPDPKWGYLSSALMGVFFSAGWSPCVGPVLGAILTLAINGGSISLGATLLTAYSIGLAIPFLIAALGVGWVTTVLKKYSKTMRYVEIAMGVILVIIGVMLFSGVFELIAQQGQFFWFDFGI